MGLDLSKYAAEPQDNYVNSFMDVVPQENIRYIIGTNGSKAADIRLTFSNEKLRTIDVLECTENLYLSKNFPNTLEMAKNFLSSYQVYSKNFLYGKLDLMLSTDEIGKNITKILDNVKLEITTSKDYAAETFRWTYSYNGIEAPSKCVVLGYNNGFFKYFIDNWDLYKIGNTSVNLTEDTAKDIAMAKARDFSWKMGSENNSFWIQNFTVMQAMVTQTVFNNFPENNRARNHDPLTLYPMHCMWVSLDKFYPGNVYGIEVYLWADSGEIGDIKERFSTMDPPSNLTASLDDYSVVSVNQEAATISLSNVLPIDFLASLLLFLLPFCVLPSYILLGKRKKK